jgi:uncharacterized protein YbjT (DUF2867 family)
MTILVTGGTGTIGAPVTRLLLERGETVRTLTRGGRPAVPGAEPVLGDLLGVQPLTTAFDGVDTVAHLAMARGRKLAATTLRAAARVVEAAAAAGVGHVVLVSIVGVDRLRGFPYYRAKLAEEELLATSGVPWSVLRATQFHPLLAALFAAPRAVRLVPYPAGVPMQPVDAADVAGPLADLVQTGPSGRVPDVGGPEVRPAGEYAAQWRSARGGVALPVPIPGRVGSVLRAGALTVQDRRVGTTTFAQWLAGDDAARV